MKIMLHMAVMIFYISLFIFFFIIFNIIYMNNINLYYIFINNSIKDLDNIINFLKNNNYNIYNIYFIDIFNLFDFNNYKHNYNNIYYSNNLIYINNKDNKENIQNFFFKNSYDFVLYNNNSIYTEIHNNYLDYKITYKNIFNKQLNFKLVTNSNEININNLIEYYFQLYNLNIIYKLDNLNYDFNNIFFKLALLHKYIDKYDDMINYYNLINNNNNNNDLNKEIIYFKYLDTGLYYEKKNEYILALKSYYKAHNLIEDRIEAIYEITKMNRITSNSYLAYIFSKKLNLNKNSNYLLLIPDYNYYKTLFAHEISILGYYNLESELKLGLDCSDNINFIIDNIEYGLKFSNNNNLDLRKNLINNYRYYIRPLSYYINYNNCFSFDIDINNKSNPNNFSINPSIVYFNNKYIISSREINYNYHLDYDYSDWSGPNIYSNNFIFIVNNLDDLKNKNYILHKKINFNLSPNFKFYDNFFMGFEDLRLFIYDNKLFGICTAKFTNDKNLNEMCLCYFDDNYDVYNICILNNYNNHINQKNWCPFVNNQNNKLQFLYSNNPTTQILTFDTSNNNCILDYNIQNNINTSFFRGNSKLIWLNNEKENITGYLYMIHEVANIQLNHPNKFRRYYYHRFVLLDTNFNIIKLSPLFFLLDNTIEFVCGLEYDENNNNIIITFGYEDKKSYLINFNFSDLKKILKEL